MARKPGPRLLCLPAPAAGDAPARRCVHDAVPPQHVHRLGCGAEGPGPVPQLPLAPVPKGQRKGLGGPHGPPVLSARVRGTDPFPLPTHSSAASEVGKRTPYKQANPAAGLVARRRDAKSVPFTRRFSACAASRSKDRAAGATPDSSIASSAAAAPRTTLKPCLREVVGRGPEGESPSPSVHGTLRRHLQRGGRTFLQPWRASCP